MKAFALTDKQEKKYKKWLKTLPKLENDHFGCNGGGTSFTFIPTSIGCIVKVHRADGYDIDLTEWKYF